MIIRFYCRTFLAFLIVTSALVAITINAQAQGEFTATHLCRMSTSIFLIERTEGIALFNLDRSSNSARFRISIAGSESAITRYNLVRHNVDSTTDILLSLPPLTHGLTEEGTLSNLPSSVIDALDMGQLYLEVENSADEPEGFLSGKIIEVRNMAALDLSGYWTVPYNDSTEGHGELFGMLDPEARRLEFSVSWRDVTTSATEIRFMRTAAQQIGPVVHTVTVPAGDTAVSGTWNGISQEDIAAFRTGNIHAIVVTTKFPNGEIRGPVLPYYTFTTIIEPEQAVPPAVGTNAQGTGYATIAYFADRGAGIDPGYLLTAFAVVHDTRGTVDGAHIHPGARGTTTETVIDLLEQSTHGGWHLQSFYAWKVDTMLLRGNTYMDFHTSMYPDGELRGHFIPAATNLTGGTSAAPDATADAGESFSAHFDSGTNSVTIRRQGVHDDTGVGLGLYSGLGVQIASFQITADRIEIPAGSLPAGIYFIRITGAGPAHRPVMFSIVR